MKICAQILGVSVGVALFALAAQARAQGFQRVIGDASTVIAAGNSHVILNTAHALYGWGSNGSGEVGVGSTSSTQSTPSLLPLAPGKVAAGANFSLAISYGKLYGWGKTDKNQTGLGASTTPVLSPRQVGTSASWRQVGAGSTHGLAITSWGALYAWGQNSDGELGLGYTSTYINAPTLVSTTDHWTEAVGGNQFSLAIKADGSLWSWGHNASGQLGNGNSNAQHSPVPVTSTVPWLAVAAGDSHALGIKADGSLWSWGANDKSQLGCNTSCPANTSSPVNISGGSTWLAVSAGGKDSFAIRSDGLLFAWGDNGLGQLGLNNGFATVKAPTAVSTTLRFQFVSAGYDFTAGVTADGTVWTWGNEASGQLGNAVSGAGLKTTVPAQVPSLISSGLIVSFVEQAKPVTLSGGRLHSAHIRASGVLETAGYSGSGALGLASSQTGLLNQLANECDASSPPNCVRPVAVTYLNVGGSYQNNTLPWNQVSTGATQTLAIRADGTLWAFGSNAYGEVGNNSTSQVPIAVQISNSHGTTWRKVFAGSTASSSFAIDSAGALWGWGENGLGQLGVGDQTDRRTPTLITLTGEYWVDIAPGGVHTLGLTADGRLWAWGNNDYGELGLDSNSIYQELRPTAPTGTSMLAFMGVEASEISSSAVDSSGTVWATGDNSDAEFGDGTANSATAFTAIPSIGAVTFLCRTQSSALAQYANGVVLGWGANSSGELATGDTNTYYTPSSTAWKLGQPTVKVACASYGSLAMDSLTTLWGAGDNTDGSLGISSSSAGPFSTPVSAESDAIYPYADNVDQSGIAARTSSGVAANVVTFGQTWDSGVNQASGQYVELDLLAPQAVSEIALLANDANSYPRSYNVQVSSNGTSWTTVSSGTGVSQGTAVAFPVQYSRYFRITLSGAASAHWTVRGNPEPLLY